MKTKMKWCGFCQKMESVKNFQKNSFKESGYQDHCRKGQKFYTGNYNENNREAINEKSLINAKYYNNKITRNQQIQLITKVNKKYGIKTRIK